MNEMIQKVTDRIRERSLESRAIYLGSYCFSQRTWCKP